MAKTTEDIQKSLAAISKQTSELIGRVQREGITSGGQVIVPPTKQFNADLGGVDGTLAKEKSFLETREAEAEVLAKEKETQIAEAKAEKGTIRKTIEGIIGKIKPGKIRDEALGELGVDQKGFLAEQKADIAEVEALRTDYDSVVAARDQQIANMMGRAGISLDFQNNSVAQINRNANVVLSQKSSAINNKVATMEAKAGNFELAMSFANQAVEDYLFELDAEYKMYQTFNQQNADKISNLTKEYQDALKSAESYALAQYNEGKVEQEQVRNLILQYPNANINIGDTQDEATQKASRFAKLDVLSVAEAKSLGVPFGTTREQAFGITPGVGVGVGQYGLTKDQERNFNNDIRTGTNALEKGKPWGDVWNEIKSKYPSIPNSAIDNALGGGIRYETIPGETVSRPVAWGWAKAGAFEKAIEEPKDKWELEGDVWAWLASPEAIGLSDEEKAQQIKTYGLNPWTFGY